MCAIINGGHGREGNPEGNARRACFQEQVALYELTIPINTKSSSEHKNNRKGKIWNSTIPNKGLSSVS